MLAELERLDEALASYDRAIALKPGYADAFNNKGNALMELERLDEALTSYDRRSPLNRTMPTPSTTAAALSRSSSVSTRRWRATTRRSRSSQDYANAFNNRGNALRELKRLDEALASYDKAITLVPDYALAFYNRGKALQDRGNRAEAAQHYERASRLKPSLAEARLALCMAQLPVLYRDETEIDERRSAYRQALEALCEAFDRGEAPGNLAKAIGSSQPFFLAYQGQNDRDLQSLYGSLICRAMAARYPSAGLAQPPRSEEPVRLGFVSGFFVRHTIWKLFKGWFSQLDRRRFRVFGYHTGTQEDAETEHAAALCDRFASSARCAAQRSRKPSPLSPPTSRTRCGADVEQRHVRDRARCGPTRTARRRPGTPGPCCGGS